MTPSIPPPPAGSGFGIDYDDQDRPRLTWQAADSRGARWFTAGFLLFWLCGWAVGEFFACWALLGIFTDNAPVGFQWGAVAFLLFWLTFWTFGGVAAMLALTGLLRRPRPERLTLGSDVLLYDPGTTPFVSGAESRQSLRSFWTPPLQELTRPEAATLRLDRVEERQRLTIDRGAERLEIGACLQEPEREWLAAVLRAWAGVGEA